MSERNTLQRFLYAATLVTYAFSVGWTYGYFKDYVWFIGSLILFGLFLIGRITYYFVLLYRSKKVGNPNND